MYKKLIGAFALSAVLLVGCSGEKETVTIIDDKAPEVVSEVIQIMPEKATVTKINIETLKQEPFKEYGENEGDEVMLSNFHLILDSKSPAVEPRELDPEMAQYTVTTTYPDGSEVVHYLWENNKDGQADVYFEGVHYTLTQQMSNEILAIIENF